MPMNKPHLEFTRVDMNAGWATPPGYPPGIKQKILASDLDETRAALVLPTLYKLYGLAPPAGGSA